MINFDVANDIFDIAKIKFQEINALSKILYYLLSDLYELKMINKKNIAFTNR